MLNSKYKILSACFTNRIKTVVDKIVGERQKGFSSKRRAHEVIINLAGYAKKIIEKNHKGCIISFDFAQAFDTVDHNYIREVFRLYEFPITTINMLKTLITGRNARIIDDNNNLSIPFTIGRGVPQGDLHSPLTFIIAISPLLAELEWGKVSESPLDGILKYSCIESFADDLTVVCKLNTDILGNVKNKMNNFGIMTGLMLNVAKTVVLPLGRAALPNDFLRLGFVPGNQLKILGITIDSNGEVKNASLNDITRRIGKEIAKWGPLKLSMRGRLNIAKCFMFSQINYHGLLTDFTIEELDDLQALIGNYVKGGVAISKKSLLTSIEGGGLGLPSIKNLLDAQRARLWTLSRSGEDHWKNEYKWRTGDLNYWGKINYEGASTVMLTILKGWEVFRLSYAKINNNFLQCPIDSAIFKTSPRGVHIDQAAINILLQPVIIDGSIRLTNVVKNENGNLTVKTLEQISQALGVNLQRGHYNKIKNLISYNIREFTKYKSTNGNNTRTIDNFLLGGNRKGSKKLRQCIETVNNVKIVDKHKVKFMEDHRLHFRADYCAIFNLWGNARIPTQIADFLFLYTTNRLQVGSRVHHFREESDKCTFCTIDYVRIRRKTLGLISGPVILSRETTLHLFFDCNLTKTAVESATKKRWDAESVLQMKYSRSRNCIGTNLSNVFILYNIYKCKKSEEIPTVSKILNTVY